MADERLDDLARVLATTTSRRTILKAALATAVGAVFSSHSDTAWGAGAGKNGCAQFCNQVFGEDTPATRQCIQDAKRGTGLCYTCGPGAPAGTQSICCTTNGGGFCASYASATCCSEGQTCSGGVCISYYGCSPYGCTPYGCSPVNHQQTSPSRTTSPGTSVSG
jgi:hypothetical protein